MLNVSDLNGCDRMVIEAYIVNKMDREFKGKSKFYILEDSVELLKKENTIKIKPGHVQILRFWAHKNLTNKLNIECSTYIAQYFLQNQQYAFVIDDSISMVSADFIKPFSVTEAAQYPETPKSVCIIL